MQSNTCHISILTAATIERGSVMIYTRTIIRYPASVLNIYSLLLKYIILFKVYVFHTAYPDIEHQDLASICLVA